jgi:hypothetical protein
MILANFKIDISANDYVLVGETVEEIMEKAAKHLDPDDFRFEDIEWYEIARPLKVKMRYSYIIESDNPDPNLDYRVPIL